MKPTNPPRFAMWLLQHFGPEANQEALAGDLLEGYRHGRSKAWYWRQVLAAIRWRGHLLRLLWAPCAGWLLSSPRTWRNSGQALSRPLDMAAITVVFLLIGYLPGMLRGRVRAMVAAFVVAGFFLVYWYQPDLADHYWTTAFLLVITLVFYRKPAPAPRFRITLRELLLGDRVAERKRLIAGLEDTMIHERDPKVCEAYERAIATLRDRT